MDQVDGVGELSNEIVQESLVSEHRQLEARDEEKGDHRDAAIERGQARIACRAHLPRSIARVRNSGGRP